MIDADQATLAGVRTSHHQPFPQYAVLAVLLVIVAAYQVRSLTYWFPAWFRVSEVAWPFVPHAEGQSQFLIRFVLSDAISAGLHEGDTLIAIDAQQATGWNVFANELAKRHPDGRMQVTVRRKNHEGTPEITAGILLTSMPNAVSVVGVLLFLVMPTLCIALGFWTAAVRPRDVRAWFLLAFLVSLAAFPNSFPELWGPASRMPGTLYRSLMQNSWPAWLFLLGVYFPEPLTAEGRRWSKWLEWVLLPSWVALSAPIVLASVGELYSVAAYAPLERFESRMQLLRLAVGTCLFLGFFASIGLKYRLTRIADSKRRLRVLYAGAAASVLPLLVTFTWANLHHSSFDQYFAWHLRFAVYVCFSLLPVTLAYVVVVQRAMDVRVVIRQGLQYALASGTIRGLRIITTVGLTVVAVLLLDRVGWRSVWFCVVVAAAFGVNLTTQEGLEYLKRWIDRRFFRDAYYADQILNDLTDKVRTIVEPQLLFATVSRRIADSLHVSRITVMANDGGAYQPAFALGYPATPRVTFPEDSPTVRQLVESNEPTLVYFSDHYSWIYRRKGMSEDERQRLADLDTELLLPLTAKDHLLGFVTLGKKRSEEPYSGSDLRLLKSVAAQTALALEIAHLTAVITWETTQREKLNQELEIAREVQQRLFPQKLPPVVGLDYGGVCRPALGVGGDYYDFLVLPGGRLGIGLGDVSGKGIAAALMMATLQASLRAEAVRVSENLAQMIAGVNNLLFDASTSDRYATFFYAEYNARERTVSYVNAGHNPPMLFRGCSGTDSIIRLDVGGTVIGLLENVAFQQAKVSLQPGDLLVLYTDGVTEAMNPKDEEWGETRMMEAISGCQRLSAAETMQHVMSTADLFAAGAPQHDDMTLVVLKILVGELEFGGHSTES